jgi:hypothetical protein
MGIIPWSGPSDISPPRQRNQCVAERQSAAILADVGRVCPAPLRHTASLGQDARATMRSTASYETAALAIYKWVANP